MVQISIKRKLSKTSRSNKNEDKVIQERHETYMRRRFIEDEIHDLQKQIQPHDTGHIHTTISTLKHQYKTLTGYEFGNHPKATTVEAPTAKFMSVLMAVKLCMNDLLSSHTERTLVKPLAVDDDDWNGYDDADFQEEEEMPFEFKFQADWKYNEEELIQEFKDYVEATYDEHYSQNKYQATEIAIEAGHGTGFCIGNILKYAQRYGRKGTAANARKDLLKIMHYALIQLYIHDSES